MKISLFTDYSLRVMMYGAVKQEAFLLDEVTAAYGISKHHLAKVVNRLAQLDYLRTLRGRGGGIRLAHPPGEIRIGALMRKTEEQKVFLECFDLATNTCPVVGVCRLKGILAGALRAFYATLDEYTLADLIAGNHREALMQILAPRLAGTDTQGQPQAPQAAPAPALAAQATAI